MRILLVEDDRSLGTQLIAGLREEGHTVDLLAEGVRASEHTSSMRESCYDVVVLDLLLPGCDGLSLCRRWRAAGLRMPILILTGRATIEDRVQGLDAGADDYLTKPFAFMELLARLRALGRREPQVQVGPLCAGDLTLDTLTRQVRRAGCLIRLTPREYAIVELLLRHTGQVLSRDQIAARAWDMDAEHASNVVDVFIRNLRRKIDDPHPRKLLHTIRGVGYTLRVAEDAEQMPAARPARAAFARRPRLLPTTS